MIKEPHNAATGSLHWSESPLSSDLWQGDRAFTLVAHTHRVSYHLNTLSAKFFSIFNYKVIPAPPAGYIVQYIL